MSISTIGPSTYAEEVKYGLRHPLPAKPVGATRVLFINRFPRHIVPFAWDSKRGFGVKAADIFSDGKVVELGYSWAGPATPEVCAKLLGDLVATAADGIVAYRGAGDAGLFVRKAALLDGSYDLARSIPSGDLDKWGSLPLVAPRNSWVG